MALSGSPLTGAQVSEMTREQRETHLRVARKWLGRARAVSVPELWGKARRWVRQCRIQVFCLAAGDAALERRSTRAGKVTLG